MTNGRGFFCDQTPLKWRKPLCLQGFFRFHVENLVENVDNIV